MPTSRYICSNVIRPFSPRARNCEKPARWRFYDGAVLPIVEEDFYYSCAGCLSAQLDSSWYIVQRVEY